MCIIVTGTSANLRRVLTNTIGLMESIYGYNSDGLGIMFPSDDGAPVALKTLPGSEKLATEWLLRNLPEDGREVALHARFTTHGKTDLDNCHPYTLDGGFLMHNGVLSTGNKPDETKSDTWHYCRWFLDGYADAVFSSDSGRTLLGHHIGSSNRFVYLGKDGKVHIVNKHTGVEYEGLWFSNTYAWDVSTLDPTYYKPSYGRYSGDPRGATSTHWRGHVNSFGDRYGHWGDDDDDGMFEDEAAGDTQVDKWRDESGELQWLMSINEELLTSALEECGTELIRELQDELGTPFADHRVLTDDPENPFDKAVRALEDGAFALLGHYIDTDKASVVADAMIYGVHWRHVLGHSKPEVEIEEPVVLSIESQAVQDVSDVDDIPDSIVASVLEASEQA